MKRLNSLLYCIVVSVVVLFVTSCEKDTPPNDPIPEGLPENIWIAEQMKKVYLWNEPIDNLTLNYD